MISDSSLIIDDSMGAETNSPKGLVVCMPWIGGGGWAIQCVSGRTCTSCASVLPHGKCGSVTGSCAGGDGRGPGAPACRRAYHKFRSDRRGVDHHNVADLNP